MVVERVGRSFGFFDCRASKEEIGGELPYIRELVRTPPRMGLSLMRADEFRADGELREWRNRALEAGIKFVIVVECPDATNLQSANELSAILNQAYQSPLYQDGEEFRGTIVYEEGGRYVERE